MANIDLSRVHQRLQRRVREGPNRRRWRRIKPHELPSIAAHLDNVHIDVIDLSRSGAKFSSTRRVLPGVRVAMRLKTRDATLVIRGEVVRSTLVKLENGALGYEAAVAFDALLTGLIADEQPLDVPAPPAYDDEDWASLVAVTAELNRSGADVLELLGAPA